MVSFELTSIKNISIFSVIVSVVWMVIMLVFGIIKEGSINIGVVLITGVVFFAIFFCLTCVFSWKNLKY